MNVPNLALSIVFMVDFFVLLTGLFTKTWQTTGCLWTCTLGEKSMPLCIYTMLDSSATFAIVKK